MLGCSKSNNQKIVNQSPSENLYGEKKNGLSTSGTTIAYSNNKASSSDRRLTKYQLYSSNVKFVASKNDKEIFAKRYSKTAQSEQQNFGIPASVKLAQAILESGADSDLAIRHKNFFGIKCKSQNYGEVDCQPHPNNPNRGNYCVYETAWMSWRAHSKFLQREYYKYIPIKCGDDALCWFTELQKSGYCPEPDYAAGLKRIYKEYNLAQYDLKRNIPLVAKSKQVNKKPTGRMPVKNYTWLLNPSHGADTPGKRKTFKKALPDGSFTIYEYKLNRKIVNSIIKRCNDLGLNYRLLVSEKNDISLKERVRRANQHHQKIGNTVLITIDHNATPYDNSDFASIAESYNDANQKVASGMESFHHKNNKEMKHFLSVLKKNIEKRLPNWHKRGVKSKNFYTIRKSKMPACITECAFFDNYKDASFTQTDKYLKGITEGFIETFCSFSGKKYIVEGVLN